MSGHSKWHNIRLRKGKQDAERGKLFTKIAKEIIVAAKAGGGNPDTNLRLRMAVQTLGHWIRTKVTPPVKLH